MTGEDAGDVLWFTEDRFMPRGRKQVEVIRGSVDMFGGHEEVLVERSWIEFRETRRYVVGPIGYDRS